MFFLNTRTLSRTPRPWNFCSFVRKVVQLNYSYKRLPSLNWNRLPNVWSKVRAVTRVIRIHRLHFPWGAAFLKHPPLKLVQCFCARHWKCFQIHPHYTHAHTRSYCRALALFPCRLFNLPPFFLCCHMKRILQAYTKTKGRSFWRLRKVCQWLFCQQPSHTKVLKTWQRIWSSLDLNIRKDKKTNESQWIKQTTESRWWKRCRGFIYYNTALTPKNNSLINILHNNGINSSLHW